MPDDIVWEDVRRVYDDHSIPVTTIFRQFGINKNLLTKARLRFGWMARAPAVRRKPKSQADTLETATTDAAASLHRDAAIAKRRAIVARIFHAIENDLKLLEHRQARRLSRAKSAGTPGTPGTTGTTGATTSEPTAPSVERDARIIGQIIKNLENVTAYAEAPEHSPALRGAAAKSAALAANQLADEADRLRRELGERLSRLVGTPEGAADKGAGEAGA